jgi:hypothetical protein
MMMPESRLGMPVTPVKLVTNNSPSRFVVRMSTAVAIVIAFIVCFTPAVEGYGSARSCLFNRHMRVNNINECRFGWEVDACNNKVCTKGPGEVCGGKHMRYGICGEGLMCNNCNRCQVRKQSFKGF